MDGAAAPKNGVHFSRRFAGWLTLLMLLAFLVSNAIVGAVQSTLPFPTTLLNNLLAVGWLLPWLVITAVVGFFTSWALLQLGRHRSRTIAWWHGGLVALTAAIVVAAGLVTFDQLVTQVASVSWTGDGASQQAVMTSLRNAVFVALSAVAGVVVASLQRARSSPEGDAQRAVA